MDEKVPPRISMETRQEHWNKIYSTKTPNEVSWTEQLPATSLELIHSIELPRSASIIDCGAGESHLADHLLDEGYTDISLLDVSGEALGITKKRLGARAKTVRFYISDVLEFKPERQFDVWHDRATFHFLTDIKDQQAYVELVRSAVKDYLLIGTFSDQGPKRCSGLDVQQYNVDSLTATFSPYFELLTSRMRDHITPFGTAQNFIFCLFKRRRTV